ASLISKNVTTNNFQDIAQEKASYCREKAKVKNTEKSTKNWMTKFEEFRANTGYLVSLIDLNNNILV
ncbi:16796_t:CDS:1, partial [Funneliformis mosseae]